MKYTNTKRIKEQVVIINQAYVEKLFNDCNLLYFENKLTPIPINIINSVEVNGDFTFNIDFDKKVIDSMVIQINQLRPRTQNQLISTMVHEMIHYVVTSQFKPELIDEAIWYYKNNNREKFDQLLLVGKYAHSGKWAEVAKSLVDKYNLKINKA